MKKPIIPKSYEDVVQELGGREAATARMMEFYKPVTKEEGELQILQSLIGSSGKLAFLFGRPGAGKSSFVESLALRPHLGIHSIVHIQANLHLGQDGLREILGLLSEIAGDATQKSDLGRVVVVIDYLESLGGYTREQVKAFFQTLNGILRNSAMLVVWPVVDQDDLKAMLAISKSVSGTMFVHGRDTIQFVGPALDDFPSITETTIQVMNNGALLGDFGITRGDLEEVLEALRKLPTDERTLRRYLELTEERWLVTSNYVNELKQSIPKPTEVWFAFPYPGAESVVRGFSRKGAQVEDAWLASHDAFFEYVGGTQRASYWDAKKLQLAIAGALKTRIFYQPTHATVAAIRAFTSSDTVRALVDRQVTKAGLRQPQKAKQSFRTSPIYRQLLTEPPTVGKRKSGPAAAAEINVEPVYDTLVKWISSGAGSDRPYNAAIAKCLEQALADEAGVSGLSVYYETAHPYIPNIKPDIMVDTPDRTICIEFHYTNQKRPNIIADYVLGKLKVYMEQVELMLARHSV